MNKINTIEDAINNPDGKSLEDMHDENVKTYQTAHERKLRESEQYRELAMKRDSALFASSLKDKDLLLEDYKFWREFFQNEYNCDNKGKQNNE